jgi:allantoicase
VVRETHLALARVVVERQGTPTRWEVVEGASLLGLADEPLGQGLPGRGEAHDTLLVTPDGGAARFRLAGQCVGVDDVRYVR